MDLVQGLPVLDLLAPPAEFEEALRLVFGDDLGMMVALRRNNLEEVAARLEPYAHGFPHGVLPTSDYTAPAITPERISLALDELGGRTADALRTDLLKYRVAERLLFWIKNHAGAVRHQVAIGRLGMQALGTTP